MAKYYVKHIYEVDIIATYLQFKKGIKSGKLKFPEEINSDLILEKLLSSINRITKKDRVDADLLVASKTSAVIIPQYDIGEYTFWFGMQLIVTNHNRIPLMLTYHLNRWKDKISFLDRLEFLIASIFEKNVPENLDKNADAIFNWLSIQRLNVGYYSNLKPQDSSKVRNPEGTAYDPPTIDISYLDIPNEDKKAKTIYIKENYIDDISDFLNPFLHDSIDLHKLKIALKGEKIDEPIRIKSKRNEFGYFMGLLKNPKYELSFSTFECIRDWMCESFTFFDKKTNDYVVPKKPYLLKAVNGTKPPNAKFRAKSNTFLKQLVKKMND
ncbi:MAG: hypothetical protein ACPG21_13875 [Crocinitomicaceae bacterium]|jgi:hypothetical protein